MSQALSSERERIVPFDVLYDTFFDRVNRYLRYRVHSIWDADDLTATVFTRALEKYHQFRGEAPVAVWLFRITHSTYVDYVRSRNRRALSGSELYTEPVEDTRPEDELLKLEELARLKKYLEMLPAEQRDVVSLRYVGELKFGQIATVLDKTESAVRMIHYRALKSLRVRLGEEG